jgi:hypothetical protein
MLHRQRGSSGAATGAQRWQSVCEGEGGMGARVCVKGVQRVPWGCLYGSGRGGEAALGDHGHEWPFGPDCKSRGGVKEVKLPNDGGRVKTELHCGLKE